MENGVRTTSNKIVFGLPKEQQVDVEPSLLEQQRARHRQRAERFKTEYVAPEKHSYLLHHEARKERVVKQRSGFVTGIDPFSKEEVERRKQRADRFGGDEPTAPQHTLLSKAEEERRRKARADKFETEYKPPTEQVLMDVDVLEGRKDAPISIERRLDTVHLFGVDLMSTGDVLKYFSDYGPTYVEWINDSSCNVLFADSNTVKRLLLGMGTPLPSNEQVEALDLEDINSAVYLWYQGPDFHKGGTGMPLLFRVATVEDVKPLPSSEHVSRGLWKAQEGEKHRGRGRGGGKRQLHDGTDMQTDEAEGHRKGRRRRRRRVTKQRQLENGDWVEDVEMMEVEEEEERDEAAGGQQQDFVDNGVRGAAYDDERQEDNDQLLSGRFRADVVGGRALTVEDARQEAGITNADEDNTQEQIQEE